MDASEEVQVDDNVDELFRQKMEKLKELGLYDDRTVHRMNQINDMSTALPPKRFNSNKRFRSEDLIEFTGDERDEEKGTSGFKPIENSSFKWSLPFAKKDPNREQQRGDNPFKPVHRPLCPTLPVDREREYHLNKNKDRNDFGNRSNREGEWKRDRDGNERKPNVEALRDGERYRDREDNGNRYRDREDNGNRYRDREDNGSRYKREENRRRDRDDTDGKPRIDPMVTNNIMDDIFNDCQTDDDKAVVSEEVVRRIDATDDRTITNVREEVLNSINKRVGIKQLNPMPSTSNARNFFNDRRPTATEKKKTETITDIEAFIRDCNKKAEKPKPLIFDDIDDFIAKANQRFDQISNMDPNHSQSKAKKSHRKPT